MRSVRLQNLLFNKLVKAILLLRFFYLKTQGGWKEGNQLEIEVKKEQKLPSLSELFGDATETKSDTTTAN